MSEGATVELQAYTDGEEVWEAWEAPDEDPPTIDGQAPGEGVVVGIDLATVPWDFSVLAAPPPPGSAWWQWVGHPELMLDCVQNLREALDNGDTVDPNDCQAALELIHTLLGRQTTYAEAVRAARREKEGGAGRIARRPTPNPTDAKVRVMSFGYDERAMDDLRHDASRLVREATVRLFGHEQGCGDGGCVFGHPGGQHTNGGCRCIPHDQNEARALSRVAHEVALTFVRQRDAFRAKVQSAKDFGDELEHDDVLGWIG